MKIKYYIFAIILTCFSFACSPAETEEEKAQKPGNEELPTMAELSAKSLSSENDFNRMIDRAALMIKTDHIITLMPEGRLIGEIARAQCSPSVTGDWEYQPGKIAVRATIEKTTDYEKCIDLSNGPVPTITIIEHLEITEIVCKGNEWWDGHIVDSITQKKRSATCQFNVN